MKKSTWLQDEGDTAGKCSHSKKVIPFEYKETERGKRLKSVLCTSCRSVVALGDYLGRDQNGGPDIRREKPSEEDEEEEETTITLTGTFNVENTVPGSDLDVVVKNESD